MFGFFLILTLQTECEINRHLFDHSWSISTVRCSLPHPTLRTIPSQSNPIFAPQCYKKTVLHPSEMPFLMENITNLQQYIIVEQIQWSIYQQINIKMLPIYFKDSSYTYQNIDKYFFQRSSSHSTLTFQRYIFWNDSPQYHKYKFHQEIQSGIIGGTCPTTQLWMCLLACLLNKTPSIQRNMF